MAWFFSNKNLKETNKKWNQFIFLKYLLKLYKQKRKNKIYFNYGKI